MPLMMLWSSYMMTNNPKRLKAVAIHSSLWAASLSEDPEDILNTFQQLCDMYGTAETLRGLVAGNVYFSQEGNQKSSSTPEEQGTGEFDFFLCLDDPRRDTKKINCIKTIRKITGWSLKEAKDFTESAQYFPSTEARFPKDLVPSVWLKPHIDGDYITHMWRIPSWDSFFNMGYKIIKKEI